MNGSIPGTASPAIGNLHPGTIQDFSRVGTRKETPEEVIATIKGLLAQHPELRQKVQDAFFLGSVSKERYVLDDDDSKSRAIKKLEEQNDLLMIERDQLSAELKKRTLMYSSTQQGTRSGQEDAAKEVAKELHTLREFTDKLKGSLGHLPSLGSLKQIEEKLQVVQSERDDLKNQVKDLTQQLASARDGGKMLGKRTPSKASRDKALPVLGQLKSIGSQKGFLEETQQMLVRVLDETKAFDSTFMRELTEDHQLLEMEFQDYKLAKEEEVELLSGLLEEKQRTIMRLRREVAFWKNQTETTLTNLENPISGIESLTTPHKSALLAEQAESKLRTDMDWLVKTPEQKQEPHQTPFFNMSKSQVVDLENSAASKLMPVTEDNKGRPIASHLNPGFKPEPGSTRTNLNSKITK